MLNATTFNYLIWENVSNLPFPKEIKHLIEYTDWSKFKWFSIGLPIFGATYNVVSGKTIYFEEDILGKINIKKEDFTGEIILYTYFINSIPDDNNYYVSFKAIFLKGDLVEVELYKLIPHDPKILQQETKKIEKRLKTIQSFWFKWLYKPYSFVVKMIGTGLIFILEFIIWLITKVVIFLTPYE